MKVFSSVALGLLVASCASLSQQECLQGDWYQIGLNDGIHGYSTARIDDHNKACSKVDVSVDPKAWEKGRRDGLKTYCTASSAYEVGRNGRHIGKVCSSSQRKNMQPAFNRGQQYYDITNRINDLDQRLREAQSKIAAALKANKGTATADVFFLQSDVFDLQSRIGRLEQSRQKFSTWP